MGSEPGAEDGAIFLGVGALSRRSLRDVTYWMEDLYVWGENAYGVIDSAATTKPARRKKTKSRRFPSSPRPPSPPPPPQPSSTRPTSQPPAGEVTVFGPPPPLIGPGRSAITDSAEPSQTQRSPEAGPEGGEGGGGMDKLVNYLKMGYGTYWTLGSSPSGEQHNPTAKGGGGVAKADDAQQASKDDAAGHYLVGLVGDVDEDGTGSDTEDVQVHGRSGQGSNRQTHLRTLTVELKSREDPPESQDTKDSESQVTEHDKRRGDGRGDTMETDDPVLNSQGGNKTKLQAVVYVNRPFIFTFLFQPGTQSLASEGLYRSLHYQVAPLRKHLINSTAYRPGRPDIGSPAVQIYDLVWDPRAMTVHSTIPNIPDPVPSAQAAGAQIWTRAEALSTHTQILNMLAATRADDSELERTAKTTRGWWIVWSRIIQRKTRPAARPPSSEGSERRRSDADSFCEDGEGGEGEVHGVVTSKEIFLIRKAGDRGSSGAMRGVSGSYVTGGGGGWADGASRLAQGIGIDTRKYIEGLLSLNR
ncbi:putative vacuolar fusion protein ccz1 protein [Phialemonium atrogriseum]|uniref:Vacuolar fusion protein ccz1 protein n=1 Tax=Phialemonium atrogriseum TaxID=1093897 RepID=A0AAJ0C8K6_9PEZI|nr:putative vacuolar fusion protein ccz1 protein [Phialemonium atrogriseum]KAK1770958.1 putative vacuolar fusion protein ccz1 protein [Phialemonium atrogriseum]